jgi:predicted RNA-binding Zn ribbon-like protein
MQRTTPETIHLWGGALCLDLANSVDRSADDEHVAPELTDVLTDPELLARWGARLGVLDPAAPSVAGRAELARVRALREALYRTFAAIARGSAPAPATLADIAAAHAAGVAAGTLVARDGAWRWDWAADDPRRVRFAAAVDAVDLLGDPARLSRLTRCPGRHCGWLFINASGRRRWCSMSACGSREKMRRAYRRRRASSDH